MDFRQHNQCYEADEHLVLHTFLAVYPQPAEVEGFLQPKKTLLDNILSPVNTHCLFGIVDIVADDDNPPCGLKFAGYRILTDAYGIAGFCFFRPPDSEVFGIFTVVCILSGELLCLLT